MKKLVTYKFKLKLTLEQSDALDQYPGVCRLIYKAAINILNKGKEILGSHQGPDRASQAGEISGITCGPEKKRHLQSMI